MLLRGQGLEGVAGVGEEVGEVGGASEEGAGERGVAGATAEATVRGAMVTAVAMEGEGAGQLGGATVVEATHSSRAMGKFLF